MNILNLDKLKKLYFINQADVIFMMKGTPLIAKVIIKSISINIRRKLVTITDKDLFTFEYKYGNIKDVEKLVGLTTNSACFLKIMGFELDASFKVSDIITDIYELVYKDDDSIQYIRILNAEDNVIYAEIVAGNISDKGGVREALLDNNTITVTIPAHIGSKNLIMLSGEQK